MQPIQPEGYFQHWPVGVDSTEARDEFRRLIALGWFIEQAAN